jgi:hypothetical protein
MNLPTKKVRFSIESPRPKSHPLPCKIEPPKLQIYKVSPPPEQSCHPRSLCELCGSELGKQPHPIIPSKIDTSIILKEQIIKSYRNVKKFYYYVSKRIDRWSYYIFCI